uniref:L antigen family member 3 n=1 Tax=Podarcis muralis TaxID=64176 RepID=A0A670KL82_PODMU
MLRKILPEPLQVRDTQASEELSTQIFRRARIAFCNVFHIILRKFLSSSGRYGAEGNGTPSPAHTHRRQHTHTHTQREGERERERESIALGSLAPDPEPRKEGISKELDVTEDIFRWRADEARILRVSISSFLEHLSLVVETMDLFGPPVA